MNVEKSCDYITSVPSSALNYLRANVSFIFQGARDSNAFYKFNYWLKTAKKTTSVN